MLMSFLCQEWPNLCPVNLMPWPAVQMTANLLIAPAVNESVFGNQVAAKQPNQAHREDALIRTSSAARIHLARMTSSTMAFLHRHCAVCQRCPMICPVIDPVHRSMIIVCTKLATKIVTTEALPHEAVFAATILVNRLHLVLKGILTVAKTVRIWNLTAKN